VYIRCLLRLILMSRLLGERRPPEIVDRMYDAWWKSMILRATLWLQSYIREGDY
jgi:hypothetical protein